MALFALDGEILATSTFQTPFSEKARARSKQGAFSTTIYLVCVLTYSIGLIESLVTQG